MGPLYGRNGGHNYPLSTVENFTYRNVISCFVKYLSISFHNDGVKELQAKELTRPMKCIKI